MRSVLEVQRPDGFLTRPGGGIVMQTAPIQRTSGRLSAVIGIGLTQMAMLFTIPGKSSMDSGITSNLTAVW